MTIGIAIVINVLFCMLLISKSNSVIETKNAPALFVSITDQQSKNIRVDNFTFYKPIPEKIKIKEKHFSVHVNLENLNRNVVQQEKPAINSTEVQKNLVIDDDFTEKVRGDVKHIYKELSKDFPSTKEIKEANFQSKLAQSISSSQRKPSWNEAPIIEEISRNGDGAIYKVISGGGTYCVYYSSNHSFDGIDSLARGIHSRTMNCPN